MRRMLASAALMMSTLWAGAVVAADRTVTLSVERMTCAACPFTVKTAIGGVPGVTSVSVSYEKKSAVVVFDDARTSIEAIAAASTNAGYPAKPAAAAQ